MMLTSTSHCSAALYVVKVLRGAPPADIKKEKGSDVAAAASEVRSHTSHSTRNIDEKMPLAASVFFYCVHMKSHVRVSVCAQLRFMGAVDVARVSSVFKEALSSFMSRRKSALTTQMFTDLFNRFPVSAAGRGVEGCRGNKVSPLTAFPFLSFFFFFFNIVSRFCA